MSDSMACPVTFKHNDAIVFATRGWIQDQKGEPYDTAQILSSALEKMCAAIHDRQLSKKAYEQYDRAVIERPVGRFTTYTEEQMTELLDEVAERIKYKLTRDSHILVYQAGNTIGFISTPAYITLDVLSDEDFLRVEAIVDLLQTRAAKLERVKWYGDHGYYVKIGDKQMDKERMQCVFNGGPFSHTPVIVEELDSILKANMNKLPRRIIVGLLSQVAGSRPLSPR